MDEQVISILAADADPSVREILRYCAAENGWQMDEAANGVEAVKLLRRSSYHMHILEMELPVIDGLMVCEHFCSRAPVIFISRKTAEEDRLAAFAAGGNDFVPKPFYPRELVARVKSLLSLTGQAAQPPSMLQIGELQIDQNSQEVLVTGRRVRLTPREYNLLLFLCKNPGKAYSRETLLNMVWGYQFDGTDRTVDTHVKSLREKIKPCQNLIVTIYGYGYKFMPNAGDGQLTVDS